MHRIELTYFNYVRLNNDTFLTDAILKCTLDRSLLPTSGHLNFHMDYDGEVDYARDPDVANPALLVPQRYQPFNPPRAYPFIEGPPDATGTPIPGPFYLDYKRVLEERARHPELAGTPLTSNIGVNSNLGYTRVDLNSTGIYWVRVRQDGKRGDWRFNTEDIPLNIVDHTNPMRRSGWPDLLLKASVRRPDGSVIHQQHFVRTVLP